MKLLQALRNSVGQLESRLKDSELFRHSGDRGEFRERIVKEFLRPFLPPCYGLGSGAVFSADGAESSQVDVVIYDSVFSNILFGGQTSSLFPCESVYGTIEVKSALDSKELQASIDNICSVKRLVREPSDMCDILPFRRLGIGAGLSSGSRVRNPYLGFIFAYRGLVAKTVVDDLNGRLTSMSEPERQQLPDFVFNHERGYMIMRTRHANGKLVPVFPGDSFDCFVHVESQKDTLALFFLSAIICLNQVFLKAPDLNKCWKAVVNAVTPEA